MKLHAIEFSETQSNPSLKTFTISFKNYSEEDKKFITEQLATMWQAAPAKLITLQPDNNNYDSKLQLTIQHHHLLQLFDLKIYLNNLGFKKEEIASHLEKIPPSTSSAISIINRDSLAKISSHLPRNSINALKSVNKTFNAFFKEDPINLMKKALNKLYSKLGLDPQLLDKGMQNILEELKDINFYHLLHLIDPASTAYNLTAAEALLDTYHEFKFKLSDIHLRNPIFKKQNLSEIPDLYLFAVAKKESLSEFDLFFKKQYLSEIPMAYEEMKVSLKSLDELEFPLLKAKNPAMLLMAIDTTVLNSKKAGNFCKNFYAYKILVYVLSYLKHYPNLFLPLAIRIAGLYPYMDSLRVLSRMVTKYWLRTIPLYTDKKQAIVDLLDIFFNTFHKYYDDSTKLKNFIETPSHFYNQMINGNFYIPNLSSLIKLYNLNENFKNLNLTIELQEKILLTMSISAEIILFYPTDIQITKLINNIENLLDQAIEYNTIINNIIPDEIISNKNLSDEDLENSKNKFIKNLLKELDSPSRNLKTDNSQLDIEIEVFLKNDRYSSWQEPYQLLSKNFQRMVAAKDYDLMSLQTTLNKMLKTYEDYWLKFNPKLTGEAVKQTKISFLDIICIHSNVMDFFLLTFSALSKDVTSKKNIKAICWIIFCLLKNTFLSSERALSPILTSHWGTIQKEFHKTPFILLSSNLLWLIICNSNINELHEFLSYMTNRDNYLQELFEFSKIKIDNDCNLSSNLLLRAFNNIKNITFFNNYINDVKMIAKLASVLTFFEKNISFFSDSAQSRILNKHLDCFIKLIPVLQSRSTSIKIEIDNCLKFLGSLPDNFPVHYMGLNDIAMLYQNWLHEPKYTEDLITIMTTWSAIDTTLHLEQGMEISDVLNTNDWLIAVAEAKEKGTLAILTSLTVAEANIRYQKYFTVLPNNKITRRIEEDDFLDIAFAYEQSEISRQKTQINPILNIELLAGINQKIKKELEVMSKNLNVKDVEKSPANSSFKP